MTKNRLLYVLVFVIVGISIFMPGVILKNREKGMLDKVVVDSNAYYYREVADSQLKFYERLKLACNQWESHAEEINISESDKTFSQVVSMAEKGVTVLYNTGFYPTNVVSTYNNWYSPSVKLYRYSDDFFNQYTCDIWCVTLIKYDNSEVHTLLIDDISGMVIAAKCEIDNSSNLIMDFGKEDTNGIIEKYRYKADIYNATTFYGNVNIGYYELIEEQSYTDLSVNLFSRDKVNNYQEAVNEVKNTVDNNKYYVAEYIGDNYFYYKLIPFSIGTKSTYNENQYTK